MGNPRADQDAGASSRLARRPEVPTRETPSAQLAVVDAVSMFAPWCDEVERALRVRIHRTRDVANARATRSVHAAARALYWQAEQIASLRVFAPMPEDELKATIDNLARLLVVAGWIERTETPDD